MQWFKVTAAAGLAEVLAYYLSLQWGFMLLVLAFIVTGLQAVSAAAKAADTEKRVNLLVPQVGAVKDTADYASGRADSAYTSAANAQNSANSAQSTASSAQGTANSAWGVASQLSIPQSRPTGLVNVSSTYHQSEVQAIVDWGTAMNGRLQAAGVLY